MMAGMDFLGPGPNWRCRLGRHDWSEFGDCARCRKPKASLTELWLSRHDPENNPYARAHRKRREARHRLGRDVQTQAAMHGHDISLELAEDAAVHGWADDLLAVVRERSRPEDPEAFAIATSRPPDRTTFADVAERDEYGMRRVERIDVWVEPDGRTVGRKTWEYPA